MPLIPNPEDDPKKYAEGSTRYIYSELSAPIARLARNVSRCTLAETLSQLNAEMAEGVRIRMPAAWPPANVVRVVRKPASS